MISYPKIAAGCICVINMYKIRVYSGHDGTCKSDIFNFISSSLIKNVTTLNR